MSSDWTYHFSHTWKKKKKAVFGILIGGIIFFTCENHRSLIWLGRIHLCMKMYDIGFWWVFLSISMINICYSLVGRSVLGETVPEVLSTALGLWPRAVLRPRAQFLPIQTDLGRWKTFLFFSYWDLKVSGKFYFSLQPMCVEKGHVRVDVMHTIDCKPKQNITTWYLTCNLYNLSQLSSL